MITFYLSVQSIQMVILHISFKDNKWERLTVFWFMVQYEDLKFIAYLKEKCRHNFLKKVRKKHVKASTSKARARDARDAFLVNHLNKWQPHLKHIHTHTHTHKKCSIWISLFKVEKKNFNSLNKRVTLVTEK